MPMTMPQGKTPAYTRGYERGWDHANYADAYGEVSRSAGKDAQQHDAAVHMTDHEIDQFLEGWNDGQADYDAERAAAMFDDDDWDV